MIYSEKQYKELKVKYEQELLRLKKENEIKDKEVKILKQQNKQKDEVIQDLDKNNYKSQCETLKIENAELKKKTKNIRGKIRDIESQLRKKQQQ